MKVLEEVELLQKQKPINIRVIEELDRQRDRWEGLTTKSLMKKLGARKKEVDRALQALHAQRALFPHPYTKDAWQLDSGKDWSLNWQKIIDDYYDKLKVDETDVNRVGFPPAVATALMDKAFEMTRERKRMFEETILSLYAAAYGEHGFLSADAKRVALRGLLRRGAFESTAPEKNVKSVACHVCGRLARFDYFQRAYVCEDDKCYRAAAVPVKLELRTSHISLIKGCPTTNDMVARSLPFTNASALLTELYNAGYLLARQTYVPIRGNYRHTRATAYTLSTKGKHTFRKIADGKLETEVKATPSEKRELKGEVSENRTIIAMLNTDDGWKREGNPKFRLATLNGITGIPKVTIRKLFSPLEALGIIEERVGIGSYGVKEVTFEIKDTERLRELFGRRKDTAGELYRTVEEKLPKLEVTLVEIPRTTTIDIAPNIHKLLARTIFSGKATEETLPDLIRQAKEFTSSCITIHNQRVEHNIGRFDTQVAMLELAAAYRKLHRLATEMRRTFTEKELLDAVKLHEHWNNPDAEIALDTNFEQTLNSLETVEKAYLKLLNSQPYARADQQIPETKDPGILGAIQNHLTHTQRIVKIESPEYGRLGGMTQAKFYCLPERKAEAQRLVLEQKRKDKT